MMKNECDEVRRTAPAGKLVSPKAVEPMQTASKWLLEGGFAICCDMLDKLDRLQDTMDKRPDDDAEYLALEAKHAGQRLLKVMQVIAETEELELEKRRKAHGERAAAAEGVAGTGRAGHGRPVLRRPGEQGGI